MDKVLQTIIRDFSICVKNEELEFGEVENASHEIDCSIYCNIWLKETLEKLQEAYDENSVFENQTDTISDLMLEFMHTICDNPAPYYKQTRKELEMVHELGYYPPSLKLLQAWNNSSKDPALENYVSNELKDIAKNSCQPTVGFFRIMLELEDLEDLQAYVPFVQNDVYLITFDRKTFNFKLNANTPKNIDSIIVPSLDEVIVVRQSLRLSEPTKLDCIRLMVHSEPNDGVQFSALITSLKESVVEFELKEARQHFENGKLVQIVFRPGRHPVRYQHRALTLLADDNVNMRDYLYGTNWRAPTHSTTDTAHIKLINADIAANPEQMKAVRTIVSGPNSKKPFIIFGPPGTGKTTTIVESIIQLRLQKPESRILVAAGSNAACDTIATRLCECEPLYREYLVESTAYPMLRVFAKEILRRGTTNLSEELVYRSNKAWNNGQHAYPAVEDLHKYGIVVTTLCTVGKLVCGDVNKNNYFTHVFIDEAGASSEPETLLGIMGIKNGHGEKSCCVILSGDHKQLGPVIKSKVAEKCGLGKSLMERLLKMDCYAVKENGQYDSSVQVRLVRNYRSHSEIVKLYNHLFYNNELIAVKKEKNTNDKLTWSFLPNPVYPIAFQVVKGEMSKAGTKSSSNLLEIDAIMAYVQMLLRDYKIEESDIGIITPYSLQSKLIRKRLDEEILFQVEVGSVEKFQGREKLIILASMVRSDASLGFVKCPRRINVLLSRPISLLIILGEPETLAGSKDLKHVIEKCKEMGNFLDVTKNILKLTDITFTTKENKPTTTSTQRQFSRFSRRSSKPFSQFNWR